ncbi:MAG: transcriptional regulator [Pedobacter sp.]|nr:MAG: transcriptional regulator [Pedobacter sp.]
MILERRLSAEECTSKLSHISDSLYVIGGKWKLPVIVALIEGSKRFNEIQRAVAGISARVLSSELKELELNGFVKRTVHANTPVVVEYEITAYADSLNPILDSLAAWGALHRDKLKNDR